jgi:PBSX family phage terminase large subunit
MRIKGTIVFQKNWEAIVARNPDGTRKYRYIINEGSSRSSKTFSLIDCYDAYAREHENKRLTVWRDTKKDCKDTVLHDTERHLKNTGRYKIGQEFNKTESFFRYATGTTFEIHGTDDDEKVHGLTQDAAWINEPYKWSRDTFDQIDQRTSDFIFIDWNPKKAHFIEDLKKDPRAIVIKSTFRDNPFCPIEQKRKILSYQPVAMCDLVVNKLLTEPEAKAYDLLANPKGFSEKQIKELRQCRENEDKKSANAFNWSVYGLGEKAEKPHRIFHWQEIPDEVYKAITSKIYTGVDWGVVDPWGIVEAKYYDGALYLHERNYLSETEIRSKLTLTELAQISGDDEGIVKHMFGKLGIDKKTEVVCDDNRPLKIAALRRAGWAHAYPANKVKGSILDGIDLLNNMPVYYTASSTNLKYEQENYSRQVDRYGIVLEEPEDIDNHLMDPSRYIALFLQARGIIKRV